jgi:hypothetical protein
VVNVRSATVREREAIVDVSFVGEGGSVHGDLHAEDFGLGGSSILMVK